MVIVERLPVLTSQRLLTWEAGTGCGSLPTPPGQPNHDVILFYGASDSVQWNPVFQAYDPAYVEKHFRHTDAYGRRYKHENPTGAGTRNGTTGQTWRGVDLAAKGRYWARPPEELEKLDQAGLIHWPRTAGAWPYIKLYLDERKGVPIQDIWTDVDPINMVAAERLDYPTQKPEALLERIMPLVAMRAPQRLIHSAAVG